MDGFWAFELERRGATEVIAIDLPHLGAGDRPRDSEAGGLGPPLGEKFELAARALGSRAEYRHLSVYDLDPAQVGEFDVVVMGYVLQMLRDPLRALEAVRTVCRGHLVLLDTVSAPLTLIPAPLARLSARRGHTEWFVFNRRGLARACELAGFVVEESTGIIRDTAGPAVERWTMPRRMALSHRIGILGRSVALRARPRQRG